MVSKRDLSHFYRYAKCNSHGCSANIPTPRHCRRLLWPALEHVASREVVRFCRRSWHEHLSLRPQGRSLPSRPLDTALSAQAVESLAATDSARAEVQNRFRLWISSRQGTLLC